MNFLIELIIFCIYIILVLPFSILYKFFTFISYKKNSSYFINAKNTKKRYLLIDAKSDEFDIKNLKYKISALLSFIISNLFNNSIIFKLKNTKKENINSFEDIYPMF